MEIREVLNMPDSRAGKYSEIYDFIDNIMENNKMYRIDMEEDWNKGSIRTALNSAYKNVQVSMRDNYLFLKFKE